jgi:hypothetical protein
MTTLTDRRIDDLILWHRSRYADEFLLKTNSSGAKANLHRFAAEIHRDTAEALKELAEFRHEEEMAEDEAS